MSSAPNIRVEHSAQPVLNHLQELRVATDDFDLWAVSVDLSLCFRCPAGREQDDGLRDHVVSEQPANNLPHWGRLHTLTSVPRESVASARRAMYSPICFSHLLLFSLMSSPHLIASSDWSLNVSSLLLACCLAAKRSNQGDFLNTDPLPSSGCPTESVIRHISFGRCLVRRCSIAIGFVALLQAPARKLTHHDVVQVFSAEKGWC